MSEPILPTSNQKGCTHWTAPGNGTATAGPAICPWCEIERLRHDVERHIAIASQQATEIERLRAALERLTNGYKYPTEVCQIAREGLSGDSSAPAKPCSICGSTEHSHLHCYGPVHETKKDGWIPTTERLPPWTEDRHEFVLVYSATHDWQGKRIEVMRSMDFYAYSPDDDDPGTDDSKVVTHWMPLPGAPSAQETKPESPPCIWRNGCQQKQDCEAAGYCRSEALFPQKAPANLLHADEDVFMTCPGCQLRIDVRRRHICPGPSQNGGTSGG